MIQLFSNEKCSLGEAPLWHAKRNSLFWVDINNKKVFEKNILSDNENYDNIWQFEFMVTALATDLNNENKLWLITEQALVHLNVLSGNYKKVIDFPIAESHRTNDAGVSPDGRLWFGTMEKSPSASNGSVYSIDSSGKLLKQIANIGIPNTMQWLNSTKLYISDSLKQVMYLYDIETREKQIIVDLTNGISTPDGGAFNLTGELWNAHWDGSQLACYDSKGHLLKTQSVPAFRPTSCCFGGENMDLLFITSAAEGLDQAQLQAFPLSGSLFMLAVEETGKEIPSFHYSEKLC